MNREDLPRWRLVFMGVPGSREPAGPHEMIDPSPEDQVGVAIRSETGGTIALTLCGVDIGLADCDTIPNGLLSSADDGELVARLQAADGIVVCGDARLLGGQPAIELIGPVIIHLQHALAGRTAEVPLAFALTGADTTANDAFWAAARRPMEPFLRAVSSQPAVHAVVAAPRPGAPHGIASIPLLWQWSHWIAAMPSASSADLAGHPLPMMAALMAEHTTARPAQRSPIDPLGAAAATLSMVLRAIGESSPRRVQQTKTLPAAARTAIVDRLHEAMLSQLSRGERAWTSDGEYDPSIGRPRSNRG